MKNTKRHTLSHYLPEMLNLHQPARSSNREIAMKYTIAALVAILVVMSCYLLKVY